MTEAKFYKKINNQVVQCQLCSHYCSIRNGKTGICQARKFHKGKLYSLVWGYPVAINIDPIEKKPFYHFQPGSFSYSLGTFGCNLNCANCQNWDISQADGIESKIKNLKIIEPKEIVQEAKNNNCQSIAYTYNEPTIWTEYALAIMKIARKNKLRNVWVSNGFMSKECLKAIIPYLDAINVDLKSIDNEFYEKNCGGQLKPILENLKIIKKSKVHLEITTLVIPWLSDETMMIKKIAEFIFENLGDEVPWHLSKFSSDISWKLKHLSPTPDQTIFELYEISEKMGLKYVYVGNLPGDERENTYCSKCGHLAISRFGYQVERLDNKGNCANCGASLDIIE